MQFRIFFKTYPETSRCSSCGKIGTIRRSRSKNFYESIIKYSQVANIYKCRECGWRGLMLKYTINRYSFITLFIYGLLVVFAAYIIRSILLRNFGS